MKTRPILFNGAMVRAILDGSKTQTRRIVKPQPDYFACGWPCTFGKECSELHCLMHHKDGKHLIVMKSPYGKVGDQLYVRETYQSFFEDEMPPDRPKGPQHTMGQPSNPERKSFAYYRADGDGVHNVYGEPRWTPSIHMPRWASRIQLEITGVRVERLQDISEGDAEHEGCFSLGDCECTGKRQYKELWESINGPGSWEANPWVWVVEFKIAKETV